MGAREPGNSAGGSRSTPSPSVTLKNPAIARGGPSPQTPDVRLHHRAIVVAKVPYSYSVFLWI